uniref:Calcium uniporter protein n=1 Tax=Parastrongyloides trichosuri TaxID=131310 RepID=A0A0N4ZVL6_PARTI
MFRCPMLLSSLKGGAIKITKSTPVRNINQSKKTFKDKANEFIASPNGKRFKILVLAGTMVVYPIGALLTNGPLIKISFPFRYNVSYDVPNTLKELIEGEYQNFLIKEGRAKKDANVTFSINKDESIHDSIAKSSLSIRFGAQIALPFYVIFNTIEEATEYCTKNVKTMNFLGEKLNIDWGSEKGQEIIKTFVLSDKAKKFLITRDMYANDGYEAYGNRSLSWATWTAFSGVFTYVFHQRSKICNGTALSFVVAYPLFLICAWFSNNQWHELYRYVQDIHADKESSHLTFDHCEGGKEYYYKMLKRNRILREFMKDGLQKISAAGDIRKTRTSIVTRYDFMKDVSKDDEEMKVAASGDTW